MRKKETQLKLIPLGGMGEIGKNMTLLEYGEDIVVIDCGLAHSARQHTVNHRYK